MAVYLVAIWEVVRVEALWRNGVQVVRAATTIHRYECYREGPSDNSGRLLSSLT